MKKKEKKLKIILNRNEVIVLRTAIQFFLDNYIFTYDVDDLSYELYYNGDVLNDIFNKLLNIM